jgi:two-component system, NtrC family, nitrogen regulation sensor histidine kinase NtrY
MKLPGRFEWKLLAAVLLVAVLAVGTASYALYFTLGSFAQQSVAHHGRIGGALFLAGDAFRAYFAERKEQFRRRTAEVAAAPPARMADLAGVDQLLGARLLEGGTVLDEWEAPREALVRAQKSPPFLAELAHRAGNPPRVLELTFGIPQEMYTSFLALQQAMIDEQDLDRAYVAVVPRYVRQYSLVVAGILAAAPLVGLFLARRVTRRLARLQEAARRVGTGDLTVRVAPTGRDELDELGRAFDRMVAELADARSRLDYLQKVSAWQEVARRLAHEIKNPLTPIQLSVQELASKYRGDDAGYRTLLGTAQEILHEEITSLRRLVDDFSAFSRLPEVAPAPVDLATLVAEAVRLHPEWHPAVQVEPAAAPVPALCDRTLFRRVIANLVENALQAAAAVGRVPQVRLGVERRTQARRAVLLVDDNGPGVPPSDRQRIFDPYVTQRVGGTGLGLAIVRKIVIDHGGDVAIQDAPPPLGGARFVVEIPSG